MSFQYTYDGQGKPVGVFIPINEWEQLANELRKAERPVPKSSILKTIKKGLKEMEAIKRGRLKSFPLQQLLNEL